MGNDVRLAAQAIEAGLKALAEAIKYHANYSKDGRYRG
jgi:hypothetical protein